MADEHVFIAHRCGYAVHFGKQLANSWGFHVDNLAELEAWLHANNPEGFWDAYSKEEEAPWVVLHDRDFGKTWTTESGYIFSNSDYVDGNRLKSGIFRVKFMDEVEGPTEDAPKPRTRTKESFDDESTQRPQHCRADSSARPRTT